MVADVPRRLAGKSPAPGWPSAPQLLPHRLQRCQHVDHRARRSVGAMETFWKTSRGRMKMPGKCATSGDFGHTSPPQRRPNGNCPSHSPPLSLHTRPATLPPPTASAQWKLPLRVMPEAHTCTRPQEVHTRTLPHAHTANPATRTWGSEGPGTCCSRTATSTAPDTLVPHTS
eukprot:365897-Chlamydomonas_euryale.AAC.4